ncbi:hypothetical protein [Actinoplanes sp. NPDC026670]|uniref:hypothetical protein n=1 Tax=Actinoplanes sp. NPDC026670 TaxID=3154700 RepID=UPI0033F86EA4
MADEMRGVVFGGPLERLRQAARVDLPRLADDLRADHRRTHAALRHELYLKYKDRER